MVILMEFRNREVGSLIDTARRLHGKLDLEIIQEKSRCSVNSGRVWSQNGYDQTSFVVEKKSDDDDERSLIAIRDSIKHLETLLFYLQKVECWQASERRQSLNRLEESRRALMELVRNHPGKQAADVLRDLSSCFGDKNDSEAIPNESRSVGKYVNWKWKNVVGFAVKLIIISASMSSMVKKINILECNKAMSRKQEMRERSILMITRNPLIDVFQARG